MRRASNPRQPRLYPTGTNLQQKPRANPPGFLRFWGHTRHNLRVAVIFKQKQYLGGGRYGFEVKWSEANQLRKPNGQFDGSRGGGGGGKGSGSVHKLIQRLSAGEQVTIPPEQLPALMKAARNAPPFNLQTLSVSGDGNENLFGAHLTDIKRKDMPQLPTDPEGITAIQKTLSDRGHKMEVDSVDPRSLKSTQAELHSTKVADIYDRIQTDSTFLEKRALLMTSEDGGVIDGHHRFAALAAHAANTPGVKIDILKVGAPAAEVVKVVQEFSGERME